MQARILDYKLDVSIVGAGRVCCGTPPKIRGKGMISGNGRLSRYESKAKEVTPETGSGLSTEIAAPLRTVPSVWGTG